MLNPKSRLSNCIVQLVKLFITFTHSPFPYTKYPIDGSHEKSLQDLPHITLNAWPFTYVPLTITHHLWLVIYCPWPDDLVTHEPNHTLPMTHYLNALAPLCPSLITRYHQNSPYTINPDTHDPWTSVSNNRWYVTYHYFRKFLLLPPEWKNEKELNQKENAGMVKAFFGYILLCSSKY